MEIAIISCGSLPVPAIKGGAVENIIENVIKENNNANDDINLTIFSCEDKEACAKSKLYTKVNFIFIKTPRIYKFIDKFIFMLVSHFFKKRKTISYRYILQRLHYIKKTAKKIYKVTYDGLIFENHCTLLSSLKYKSNFNRYKNKYAYHAHNEINSSFGNEKILRACPLFFGVSNFINEQVKYRIDYSQEHTTKFFVLKNMIDRNHFLQKLTNDEKRKILVKLNIPLDARIIVFTGRLSAEKGIIELLEAFNQIFDENLYLLIVGSQFFDSKIKTSFDSKLRLLAKPKQDKIIFTGYVPYQDIWKFYKISDIVVLPSIWDDPAPLTIMESIVSNSILITTNSGGIPEYVSTNCCSILDRNNDLINNLKNEILNLLYDENKRISYRENMKKLSIDISLENYYREFCKIIKFFVK